MHRFSRSWMGVVNKQSLLVGFGVTLPNLFKVKVDGLNLNYTATIFIPKCKLVYQHFANSFKSLLTETEDVSDIGDHVLQEYMAKQFSSEAKLVMEVDISANEIKQQAYDSCIEKDQNEFYERSSAHRVTGVVVEEQSDAEVDDYVKDYFDSILGA
ncbi:hypothetical protein Droror1_Dr00027369 [Drosera rotundifolia]